MNYNSQIETITPAKAAEYLKSNTLNRPLSKNYVLALADQMRRGQWRMNGEAIIFSESGRLLDGQHRLAAIIKSGVSVTMAVTRGISEDVFHTIDTGKGRTGADVFAIAGIKNYAGISAGISRFLVLAKGRNQLFHGGFNARDTKITRQDLLEEYYRTPELYQSILKQAVIFYKDGYLMKISEIFAVITYLLKVKNHTWDLIMCFFEALCMGEYCDCNAVKLYRNLLIRDMSAHTKMTAAMKQNLLAKTWNAYVYNKDLKLLRWRENEGNIDFA